MSSRQESVDALKHTLQNYGTDFFMGWLAGAMPWTQLPFVHLIVKTIVSRLAGDLLTESEYVIFVVYIDLRVDAQGIALEDSMIANYRAQTNPTATQAEKDVAENELKNRFANFAVLGSH